MAHATLSPRSTEALRLLGMAIRVARKRRGWTTAQLSKRVGVSAPTIMAIEAGKPTVAIGTVFEAATLVGVGLFGGDEKLINANIRARERELELLPATVRTQDRVIDDDF